MKFDDLRQRIYAAAKTGELMLSEGYDQPPVPKYETEVAKLLREMAEDDGRKGANSLSVHEDMLNDPRGVTFLGKLLSQYDKKVVQSSVQLRTYITNRLLMESDSPDAKIRIRALELLGKITDVGLFTERSEVTINSKSSSELEASLREKLRRIMDNKDVSDAIEVAPKAITTPKVLQN